MTSPLPTPDSISEIAYRNQAITWDDEDTYQRDLAAWASWARKRAQVWAVPRPWAATTGGDPAMACTLLDLSTRIMVALVARRARLDLSHPKVR